MFFKSSFTVDSMDEIANEIQKFEFEFSGARERVGNMGKHLEFTK